MVIFLFNLHDILWHRLDELTSDCLEQKELNDTLRIDLAKQEDQNKTFKKVIVPFCFLISKNIIEKSVRRP